MAVTGTGKKPIFKGVWTQTTADRATYAVNAAPTASKRTDNLADEDVNKGSRTIEQVEADKRLALQRARGVIHDDEPGHA